MTILGMAIVLVQLRLEIGPLRTEVKNLRQQVGLLTIEAPELIQAVGVPSDADNVFKWRVYVPPGQQALMLCRSGDVTATGYPRPDARLELDAGESLITVRGRRLDDRSMLLEARIRGHGDLTISLPSVSGPLTGMYETRLLSSEQKVMGDDGRLQLMKKRYAPPGEPKQLSSDEPLTGFMIWLEPTK
jgi:hypothetical protein